MAVSIAIKRKRLVNSVTAVPKGATTVYEIDPVLADREWLANSDYTDTPHLAPEGADIGESSEREKYWKAQHAELKFKRDAGDLVLKADVDAKLRDVFTSCKTKLLGIPSRARQQLPHLSDTDVVLLTALVREALEELADGAA